MSNAGASIAFVNGDVWTMDDVASRRSAVLVVDGVITLVGGDDEVAAAAERSGAALHDAGGRTIVPGFIDAHTHLELTCCSNEYWMTAHTPPHADLVSVKQRIREQMRHAPRDGWLVVRSSFAMHAKVAERRLLTRTELDEISPGRPLAVAAGLHVMSLNTAAMIALGILDSPSTEQMVIHRDEDGMATGVVTEVHDRLPAFTNGQVSQALRKHVPDVATRYGVTTVATISNEPAYLDVAQELFDEGMPLRLRSYWHAQQAGRLQEAIDAGHTSDRSVPNAGFGGIKVFVDGQGGDGLTETFLDFKWTQQDLDDLLIIATDARVQVLMHAVTPEAVRRALAAIERSNGGARNPMRHRIEHGGDYLDISDLDRIRAAGAILVTTPQFISSTAGEATDAAAPLRTIRDAGVRLVAGTDTTGTVPEGASPLYNIACAIHRGGPGTTTDRSQSVTFANALAMFTSDAAYAIFEEATRGQVREGFAGDLVLLDRPVNDITTSDGYFDVVVDRTIFAGRVVYEREMLN